MNFTDLFIRKPVVATVVSLLILVLGLRSIFNLPVNQYPKTENAVVTITTAYYGADAATVGGLHHPAPGIHIAQAQGIDYLSSTSVNSVSTITATLRLNYSANKALTEITTQVNAVQQPAAAPGPAAGDHRPDRATTPTPCTWASTARSLPTNNITDYLVRVVKPKLDSLEGVQTAEILGARNFALRAWLDPQRMAAHGVTATRRRAGAGDQQLPVGPGHHQGPDGERGPHGRHGPAHGGGVQEAGRPPERRRHRAPGGRGHRRPRAPTTTPSTSPSTAGSRSSSGSRWPPRPTSSTWPSGCAAPSPRSSPSCPRASRARSSTTPRTSSTRPSRKSSRPSRKPCSSSPW